MKCQICGNDECYDIHHGAGDVPGRKALKCTERGMVQPDRNGHPVEKLYRGGYGFPLSCRYIM